MQSVQDVFLPISHLFSWDRVTRRWGLLSNAGNSVRSVDASGKCCHLICTACHFVLTLTHVMVVARTQVSTLQG